MIDRRTIDPAAWAELRQIERENVAADIRQTVQRLNQLLGRAAQIGLPAEPYAVEVEPGRYALGCRLQDQ